jgi:hypothetical protein
LKDQSAPIDENNILKALETTIKLVIIQTMQMT